MNGGVLLVTPCIEGLIDNGLSTTGGDPGRPEPIVGSDPTLVAGTDDEEPGDDIVGLASGELVLA